MTTSTPSPSIVKKSFQLNHQYFFQLLGSSLAPLLILLVVISLLNNWFHFMSQMAETSGNQFQLIMNQLGQGLSGLLISATLIFLIPLRAHDLAKHQSLTPAGAFAKKTFLPLFVESIRVFTSVLLWTLLFILPGLYRYLQLTFVPYVVFFDPEYDQEECDALEKSKKIFSGHALFLILVMVAELLLNVGLEMATSELQKLSLMPFWVSDAASTAFTLLLSCYTYSLFYHFFSLKSEFIKEKTP